MQDKLTSRQVQAWGLCILSVPAAMALCGAGWLWVLAGAAAAALYGAALRRIQYKTGFTVTRSFFKAYGNCGGRVVAAAELLWLLLAAAGAASACRLAFDERMGVFGAAVPLFLAALVCRVGKVGAARVGGVVALVLLILYSIFALGAVWQIRWQWCAPQGTAGDGAMALCLCLAPVAVLFFTEREELPVRTWGYDMAGAVLPALPAFLTAACLSPELASCEVQPLMTLSKSLSVLSVMQRFEVLLSVAQLLGLVMLLAAMVCAAQNVAWALAPKTQKTHYSGALCLAAFAASYAAQALPVWIWAAGAAIFWGIAPILTQFIVNIKNSKKI